MVLMIHTVGAPKGAEDKRDISQRRQDQGGACVQGCIQGLSQKRRKVVIQMGGMVEAKERLSDSKKLGWSGGKYDRTESSELSCQ